MLSARWSASTRHGPGKLTFDRLLGVGFVLLALGFAAILVVALVGLEAWRPWPREIGPDADGMFEEEGAKPAMAPLARA